MYPRAVAVTAIAVGLALAGCTSALPLPSEPTPTLDPVSPSETALPILPAPPLVDPPMDSVVEKVPDAAPEITRLDAYELCKTTALEFNNERPDPRNTYATFEDSYIGAVDGWWRVWIPGVEHPDGAPTNIALTCALIGYVDNPTFYSYGGVASDYYPDRAAYFDQIFEPYDG